MRVMYDAIYPVNIPDPNPTLVGGYVGGYWPTYSDGTIQRMFPNSIHVPIAVAASYDATVLDVEQGDATPEEVPGWVMRQRARGQEPTVYMNAFTWPYVVDICITKQVAEPQWWVAKYDGIATLMPGATVKQYLGDIAPGYDMSVVADYWPGVDQEPDMDQQEHDALMAIDARLGAIDKVDWSILGDATSPGIRSLLAKLDAHITVVQGMLDPAKFAAALLPLLPTGSSLTVADVETALRAVFADAAKS